MVIRYVFAFLFACALIQPANAQPTLIFKRVEVMYPKIRLAFKVTCGGTFRNDLQPQHFEVYENGLKVKSATLFCPPDPDCCVSVALVLDRSGSMDTTKFPKVKNGAAAFVNSMNPDGLPCDEAAIVSFNDFVTLDIGMTSEKPQLLAAINAMSSIGWTALWDACAVGIQELANSGKNRCRAVVVLTDGGDNRSQYFRTVQAVAQFALSQDVKVYTIGYGVADPAADNALRFLANATGGEYYQSATGSDLAQIYASIKQSVKEAFQECTIEYETGCPDGSQRVVELQLKDFCGGSSTQTRTYVAPLDRSQFQPVGLRIGDGEIGSTRDIVLPLVLETPVNGVFGKAAFSIGYDRNVMQLINVTTAGTLLEGRSINVQMLGSGASIQVLENIEFNTTGGVLCNLHFRAGDVAQITYRPIELLTWNFEAYCLIPQLHPGRLKINPREPILTCEVTGPDALNWNDQEKRYEPNPFNVSVTVLNSGTKEAWNVRATIVTNPSIVELVTPTANSQLVSPRIVPPGGTATASWTLRATKQDNLDSIPIYFSIQADNYPNIACWKRIIVDPALSSALVCEISAPDTIYFREQYYEPEEFDITVRARNVGSGQTRDVRAQLLQDTRFTIVPPASRDLAAVLAPGATAEGTFRVQIHPRDTDGYDTVRVNVQGDDTNPAWCQYPIWVQRVRMPEFTLTCSTAIDSLVFNDETYEYEPNPFIVNTVATNVGETYAEECLIMLAGPPRFTPIGTNLRPEGTMQVGDIRTEQWSIRALPRNVAGWDTLVFQVLGRGGLGRQIVIAECRVPVFVPEVRRPEYQLSCSAPDSMYYIDNRYQPDPMPFTMRITNTGNAIGRGLSPTIIPPPSVSLAEGEVAERYIPALGIGESVDLTWNLQPELRSNDGDYRICAQVVDSIGVTEQCCVDVHIPKTENPILMSSCWSVDTLFLDPESGAYLGNPFEVVLNLTNVGLGTAENVRASIAVLGSFMQIIDPIDQIVGDLDAGSSVRLTWRVKALKRLLPADVPIVMSVSADNHDPTDCQVAVHVPAMQMPVLQTVCSSTPEDSLYFDWETGKFVYPICTLTFTVTNVGEVNAHNVSALLVQPSGVTLAPGEETLKPVDPSVLAPGASGTVTWKFSAMRANDDMLREFQFIARADNAADAPCTDDLLVEGSPKRVTLSLPEYTLLRYGEKQEIPVYIDRTIGKDVSEYALQVFFDPSVLHILGVTNSGTLTGIGWVGAKLKQKATGHIEITDYTTGTALAREAGILLKLQVEGSYKVDDGTAGYGESMLHMDSTTSLLNRSEIDLGTIDGRVIATNQCLEPLVATDRYILHQNRPNPFNPETIIEYTLPRDDYIRLVVFDRHGREVAVLAEGHTRKGSHSARFSGAQLSSGLYFYRLETSRHYEVRKMVLSR
jgi:uncharacterized protein YegL